MLLISKCDRKKNRGQEKSYQYSKYSILWRENAMSPARHGTNWPRPRRNAKNCKKNQVVLSNWWEKDLWQHTLALLQVHDRTQMNKLTRNSSKSNKRQVASVFSWCTQEWAQNKMGRVPRKQSHTDHSNASSPTGLSCQAQYCSLQEPRTAKGI